MSAESKASGGAKARLKSMRNALAWQLRSSDERFELWAMRGLPAAAQARLVRRSEQVGRPRMFSVQTPNPLRNEILVEAHVVSRATTLEIGPTEALPLSDAMGWPDREAFRLQDVIVDVPSGLVFHGSRVVVESGGDYRPADDSAFVSGATTRVARASRVDVAESVLPCGTPANYYHFVAETLPRLLAVRQLDASVVALFFGRPQTWVTSILETLQIPARTLSAPVAHCRSVWTLTPGTYNWPFPADIARVVEHTLSALGGPRGVSGLRLALTRSGTGRVIKDEKHITEALVDRGFTILDSAKVTFGEQVRLFQSADVVVAEHGAGLTNIIFMNPGCRVVEFTEGSWWTAAYRRLSAMRGLRYELVGVPMADGATEATGAEAWDALSRVL